MQDLLIRREAERDYLLRDEFTDYRAAGGVNNTSGSEWGNRRVVVDTGNNLSIINGVLTVGGGTGTHGDPGLWLNAVTRRAGQLVVGELTHAAGATSCTIGWAKNQASGSASWENIFNLAAATQIRAATTGGTLNLVVGSKTAATTYAWAVILKSAGAYYFVKGGSEYLRWTLLWIQASANTATVYPACGSQAAVFTSDHLRVPAELWLPNPQAYDTFTRANGALGSTEVAGPDGQQAPALAWADSEGTWAIAGNVATCSALAAGVGVATVNVASTNVLHQVNLTRAGGVVGGVVRYVDSNNYIYFGHNGANALLTKRVAGVETPVISAVAAYAAGATCVCVADGTAFSLYYNNAQIGTTSTISDAALQAGTRLGLYTTNTGNSMDVMQTFPRGTGGEYEYLNNF